MNARGRQPEAGCLRAPSVGAAFDPVLRDEASKSDRWLWPMSKISLKAEFVAHLSTDVYNPGHLTSHCRMRSTPKSGLIPAETSMAELQSLHLRPLSVRSRSQDLVSRLAGHGRLIFALSTAIRFKTLGVSD